jgi:hypothetical protein
MKRFSNTPRVQGPEVPAVNADDLPDEDGEDAR